MTSFKPVMIVAASALLAAASFGWRSAHRKAPTNNDTTVIVTRKSHRATDAMITASEFSTGRPAPPFRAVGNDGNMYSLNDWNTKWPVVLVFIKDGCPCSKSAERFFQQLHTAAGGHVPFFGIIDGNENVARQWVETNGTPYPVLADPNLDIIRAYNIDSSAYVALIAPGGKIERLWPGWSFGMLCELTEGMSRLSGREVDLIEAAADAPEEIYSGCPY